MSRRSTSQCSRPCWSVVGGACLLLLQVLALPIAHGAAVDKDAAEGATGVGQLGIPVPPDFYATWFTESQGPDATFMTFGAGRPPIPADFFNPGSLPFEGTVYFHGGEIDIDNFGETSMIIQRTADPVAPSDPPGAFDTVQIELVQLQLVSTQPIVVKNVALDDALWWLRVDQSDVAPPAGNLTAVKTHGNGGTFDFVLPIQPRFTFTNPETGDVRVLDTGLDGQLPYIFTSQNNPFVHFLNPDLAAEYWFHPAAQWVPGFRETTPGDPTSQQPETTSDDDPSVPSRHTKRPPRREKLVCIYRAVCVDGSCDLCPICTGDLCQNTPCPNGTCSGALPPMTCGPDCCIELVLDGCRPPNGEPFCPQFVESCPEPCDPTPGACCHPDGSCSVIPECDCDGVYLGDGTTCGNFGACCFGDGTCTEMDEECCVLAGGTFEGGTCDPPVGCCLGDGSCIMVDPECCLLMGGQLDPDGVCDPPQKCCLPDGSCINTDPGCCILAGGVPGAGGCTPQRCCLPNGSCMDTDPDCCILAGGQPGPGLCGLPQRCCIGGTCIDTDQVCCQMAGGINGPGTCGPALECCLPGSPNCINEDQFCCTAIHGGTPGNAACEVRECCVGNGNCLETDPDCCLDFGGTPGPGPGCDPARRCCLPNGICVQAEPDCCVNDLGGTPTAGACMPAQTCCMPNGTCVNTDPACCLAAGGTPGPGLCQPPQRCCLPDGSCQDTDPNCCLMAGGVPGPGLCAAPTRCCIGGACINSDMVCCTDAGGIAGPGVCGPANQCCLPGTPNCVNDDQFCCIAVQGGNPGNAPCTVQECCLGGGNCVDTDPDCCADFGATPGPDANCDAVQRCCLPNGGCVQAEPDCCSIDLGGTPDGLGACNPTEGCCMPNGDCTDDDPGCCVANGGTPQGPGSSCTAPEACCVPGGIGFCVMLDPLCCQDGGGVPQGAGSVCTQSQACCLPNGTCLPLDPLCCDENGGVSRPGPCLGDMNGNLVDDACEQGPGTPTTPVGTLGCKKNRYISFEPNNAGLSVAFRVVITASTYFPGSVGAVGWVDAPDANGLAKVVGAPVFRVWTEPVVHAGDCYVHPVATYEVRATDGMVFSAPLSVMTIDQPLPKFWGDTVGSFVGGVWDCPNGVVNANDFVAALQKFQSLPTAPHASRVDVVTVSAADPCLNRVTNIADVFLLVKAFQGDVYPFVAPPLCPLCP